MQPKNAPPVIGVFPDRNHAEGAIDDLWHRNFRHDQVGILIPGRGEQEAQTETGPLEETAADGTSTGAVAGGTLGAIIGAVVAGVIPGIGPVLAGGILIGAITGAAAGAALGVYVGPFVAMGLSEHEARHYAEQLRTGRTLVVVHAEGREDEVRMVLHKHRGAETVQV